MPDLLLEIGCEEIPARMIEEGAAALWSSVRTLLEQLKLSPPVDDPSDYGRVFYTPRRLAALFPDVSERQSDVTESVVGPAVKIAFKDGQPTPAAVAFAKKVGVETSHLKTISTPKGDYLAAEVVRKGRPAIDLLAEMIPREIFSIPWPKAMYWEKKNDRFVRPIRWLVALLDNQLVPVEAFGVRAGNVSRGHRQLAGVITIDRASNYEHVLAGGKVVGDWKKREQQIRKALDVATRTIPGARWREDKVLLDTVINLTEWPSVILGAFDREFLELPEEVLVTVMRDHQKYFAVEDASGKLLPHFLAVLNTDGDADGIIRHGHERVLRARFNDARFFWQTDQKHPLRERVQWLKQVTFQKDLGSYYEKTLRVQRLCSWLCEIIRQGGMAVRPGVVHKAAYLAKTDLTTELVKEFTELQGVIGGLYARVQQLDEDLPKPTQDLIAQTIYDQYKPESMEDSVPRTVEGAVLAIGDKADSIAGMFALGLQPTGSKDPFALRRQANGIVKIIAEHKLRVSINVLMLDAYNCFATSPARPRFLHVEKYEDLIRQFFKERLQFYLKDISGFSYDVVNAVLAGRAGSDDVVDAVARAKDVTTVRGSADFQAIAVAFKRTKNILKQGREAGYTIPDGMVTPPAECEAGETELSQVVVGILPRFKELVLRRNYVDGLREMARIRGPLDKFFDDVMVMVDDECTRSRRLAMLNTILYQFSSIADFSEIVTEGKD